MYVIIEKTNGNEFVRVPVKTEADYKRGITRYTTDGTNWKNATLVVRKDARPWNHISLNWIISGNLRTQSKVNTESKHVEII